MAKAIKQQEESKPEEQTGVTNPVITADIPAQLPEGLSTSVKEIPATDKESEEILFLRRILQIQDDGGWGKHLHAIIYDRIKELS